MTRIMAIFLIPLFLMGCQSTSFSNNNPDNDVPVASKNDEYFLRIAKDLYVAKQYNQAYQIVSDLAKKDNVEAQYLSGYLLYYGQGIAVDIEQGTKLIAISADAGYRPAIEALVFIRHGLTPNNKCLAIEPIAETTTKIPASARVKLEDEEIVTAPEQEKTDQTIQTNSNTSDKLWHRYTIQLINTQTKNSLTNYVQAFKEHYPDLNKFIITYQSKSKPDSFGVGFNTFETTKDANQTLDKLKLKLNDTTLWIKPLQGSVPISIF